METSIEYAKAIEASNIAGKAYGIACKAYRTREIDDSEYIKARKAHDIAVNAFDIAFVKERSRLRVRNNEYCRNLAKTMEREVSMNAIVVQSVLDCPFRKNSPFRYGAAQCIVTKQRCNLKKRPRHCSLPVTVQYFKEQHPCKQ